MLYPNAFFSRIKSRHGTCTLPNIDLQSVTRAAWPGPCDASIGFAYDVCITAILSIANIAACESGTPSEIESFVSHSKVCSTCWNCSSNVSNNLAWRCAQQQVSVLDVTKEKNEALILCGYQQQLVKEQWHQTCA